MVAGGRAEHSATVKRPVANAMKVLQTCIYKSLNTGVFFYFSCSKKYCQNHYAGDLWDCVGDDMYRQLKS